MRTSPRQLGTLAILARRCIAAIEAAGGSVDPRVPAVADAVMRLARGERVTKAELEAHHEVLRNLKGEGPFARSVDWEISGLRWLCAMAETGKDHAEEAANQLGYGLNFWGVVPSIEWATYETWQAEAAEEARGLSSTPIAANKPSKKRQAAVDAALARASAALGVELVGVGFDPKQAGDPARLTALLVKHGYPAHPSVLAFDATFGGLLFGEDDDATLVGAHACLNSGAHVHPDGGRPGLVPVAYTASDGIVFLDEGGRAWFQDTIGDEEAGPIGADGAAGVAWLLESEGIIVRR
jgi:hypothetical protein